MGIRSLRVRAAQRFGGGADDVERGALSERTVPLRRSWLSGDAAECRKQQQQQPTQASEPNHRFRALERCAESTRGAGQNRSAQQCTAVRAADEKRDNQQQLRRQHNWRRAWRFERLRPGRERTRRRRLRSERRCATRRLFTALAAAAAAACVLPFDGVVRCMTLSRRQIPIEQSSVQNSSFYLYLFMSIYVFSLSIIVFIFFDNKESLFQKKK